MAQNGADKSSPSVNDVSVSVEVDLPVDEEAMRGALISTSDVSIEVDTHELVEAPHSVDKLLAITGEGWDIDEQVRTLKVAALEGSTPSPDLRRTGAHRAPTLALPTPFDIGAKTSTAGSVPSPAPSDSTAPPALGTPASKPPPLPSTRPSKGPPPLPTRASKGPPPLPGAALVPPSKVPPPPVPLVKAPNEQLTGPGLIDLLNARVLTLEGDNDRVGIARVHMELAIANELLADEARANTHADAALRVDSRLAAAHSLLRRRKHGRGALNVMLSHLEHELSSATAEAASVELIVERARLLEALGDKPDAVRAGWDQALTRSPHHAAALKGLESELAARANADSAEAHDALATHLARMADAYASEPRLAAWLHVERAHILERRLGRVDAARGALERALELDGSVGPVRDAYVSHIAGQQDMATLASLLEQEAQIEVSSNRSARLELEAATIAQLRLRDDVRAISLLERAAARSPSSPSVDRRVLDDLVRLYEAAGRWPEAARVRRARLRFMTDAAPLAFELRALAMIGERTNDIEAAIAYIQRAMSIDAADPTLIETLDRYLGSAGKDEARMALWLGEAARTEDGPKRARALARAAQIAERNLDRPADAVRHLRAAWIASPGDAETLDTLSRLLSPQPSARVDGPVRGLIELYVQAEQSTKDPARRVAYLEKIAVLWEEMIGDAQRAARTYEEILEIEPGRRGAILGLSRTAARLGDGRALSRSLLDEAGRTDDPAEKLSLRVRAALALARLDPTRALSFVGEVLASDPSHVEARNLETRLHEEAGRWESAAMSMRARIDHAKDAEKVSLWLALAQLQDARLRAPFEALKSLVSARAEDPAHPVPPLEIARVLEATNDDKALRGAMEDLGETAITRDERARFFVRAAEIDELRLGDDTGALRMYGRARKEMPEDELIADRLQRVLARRIAIVPGTPTTGVFKVTPAGMGELAAHFAKRLELANTASASIRLSFEHASLLVELGQDLAHATKLLEQVLVEQPNHIPALRTLEIVARRTSAWVPLARVLSRQGEAFKDVTARLGALWNLAALEEWRLPQSDSAATYARILDLDPTDPGALEATVRRDLGSAKKGDPRARKAVIGAMRALCALAADDGTQLAMQLRLALLLETASADVGEASGASIAREALDRYGAALSIDNLSVTAATGLARLSNRLADTNGAVLAAVSLANLAAHPSARARYLFDAADLLCGPDEDVSLGTTEERHERACGLLERALEAEPDSTLTARRLATIRMEHGQGERLVDTFRSAIHRAKLPEAVITLGSEIAHVARDELGDLTVAIDAMRRVQEMAPQHVPSLLLLSELCIAQRSWPEAVLALEGVVATSREVAPRLTALFALASVYEKVLARSADAERVLRTALSIDADNPRAIRALIHRLATNDPAADGSATRATPEKRREIAELLVRLTEVERDKEKKTAIFMELAEIRTTLDDALGAERALIEAVAHSPNNTQAFARLGTFFRTPKGRDVVSYARALAAVVGRGQKLGTLDPRWLAALGQLEIQSMGRVRDGVSHLQKAVVMDPSLHETRFELAAAYAKLGSHEEASRTMMAMLIPSPKPILSISDPAAGLELLESSMSAERRPEEALVVSELRAIAGDLDEGRHAWLRNRRLGPLEAHHAKLDRPTLVTHVLPPEGRHVMLEIAAAIAGIESEILRADVTDLGISARDRVKPRSGHPTKVMIDRLAKALELPEVDLVIADKVKRTRVLALDSLWVVVPRSLTELPEPTQLASLGRALARIALGVPWLEEVSPSHVEALLVACARQVMPSYGTEDLDVVSAKLAAKYEPNVTKVLTRRQRKTLEELAPHLSTPQGRPMPVDVFVGALARAELRVAYLLTGDLLATIDELRGLDVKFLHATESPGRTALAATLEHAFAGDVSRFALTTEATALRRRVGATWTG